MKIGSVTFLSNLVPTKKAKLTHSGGKTPRSLWKLEVVSHWASTDKLIEMSLWSLQKLTEIVWFFLERLKLELSYEAQT